MLSILRFGAVSSSNSSSRIGRSSQDLPVSAAVAPVAERFSRINAAAIQPECGFFILQTPRRDQSTLTGTAWSIFRALPGSIDRGSLSAQCAGHQYIPSVFMRLRGMVRTTTNPLALPFRHHGNAIDGEAA